MTAKSPSFPIFHLPGNVIKHVVRSMEPLHSLALSLCSKVTKSHIKSTALKCSTFSMFYVNPFRIEIEFDENRTLILTCRNDPCNFQVIRTCGLDYDYFNAAYNGDRNFYRWENREYETSDWIHHLLSVLNRRHVDKMYFEEGKCSMHSIRKSSEQLQVNSNVMERPTSAMYSYRILLFLKRSNNIYPNSLSLENYWLEKSPQLYIQNFDSLRLSDKFQVTLNDILMMNAVSLVVESSKLTMNDLKRFIQLWMENGTNRRLKYLQLRLLPMNPDRMGSILFKIMHTIHRKDGTEATISMRNGIIHTVFEMCVSD